MSPFVIKVDVKKHGNIFVTITDTDNVQYHCCQQESYEEFIYVSLGFLRFFSQVLFRNRYVKNNLFCLIKGYVTLDR